jgi:hypothetical protein
MTQEQTNRFQTPTSPASAAQHSSSPQDPRRAGGVRKLFSLTNLRSSFSSSRTSLSIPRQSHDTHHQPQYQNGVKRPSSPSMASTTAASTTAPSSLASKPQLRQKKSGNWFKRKSGMFGLDTELEAVDENQRPDTRESKRLKDTTPAPMLPEIGSLGGGTSIGGDLGWDERAFKRS